jgi:hypothetical protein
LKEEIEEPAVEVVEEVVAEEVVVEEPAIETVDEPAVEEAVETAKKKTTKKK